MLMKHIIIIKMYVDWTLWHVHIHH